MGVACATVQKASYHFSLAEYDTAFQLIYEALKQFKAIGDDFGKAMTLKAIGCMHAAFSQSNQALGEFSDAFLLLLPLPETHQLGEKTKELRIMMMNIGHCYFQQMGLRRGVFTKEIWFQSLSRHH
ncbi:MAG: hypothetical protein ACUVRP_02020 [Chlorobiales bacterium]